MMDVDYLAECVLYDYATQCFFWRQRPASHFKTKVACTRWNTRFAGKIALASNDRGYLYGRIDGKKVYAHRALWAVWYGYWPGEIDHIDGNPSNNAIDNLRVACRSGNSANVKSAKNASSKFLGVYWSTKDSKWIAAITKDRAKTVLGYFDCENAAAKAYDAAALRLHGDFANPNFGGRRNA